MEKKKMSKVSQEYKQKRDWCIALSMILNFGPLLAVIIYAMFSGYVTVSQKFVVGSTCTIAIILLTLNALCKLQLRCPVFIILFGLLYALFKMQKLIMTLMFFICVVQVLDDLILTPGYKKYNKLLTINKEIDKRG